MTPSNESGTTDTVSEMRRDDGTVYGRRCTCGGFWKVYQRPHHEPACRKAAAPPASGTSTEPDVCVNCGGKGEVWTGDGWLCVPCAECDICGSICCEDPDHA